MAAKKTVNLLLELKNRCHPAQMKHFKKFAEKSNEYKIRVQKYPAKLPTIDWEYYRTNVREDYVQMVNEFEQKYKEMNVMFDERDKLDTCEYYRELEEQREVVEKEIADFICASNERIKDLEKEYERIKNMMPYEEMTMEDYCDARPELPLPCCFGKPSFWPHLPDEQFEGPVGGPGAHHGDEPEPAKTPKPKNIVKADAKAKDEKKADAKAKDEKKADSKDKDKKSKPESETDSDNKKKK